MPENYPINHNILAEDFRNKSLSNFTEEDSRWLLEALHTMCNAYDEAIAEKQEKQESITTDNCPYGATIEGEFVRKGDKPWGYRFSLTVNDNCCEGHAESTARQIIADYVKAHNQREMRFSHGAEELEAIIDGDD